MDAGEPLVTVVIPTYRDWERLSICLDALAEQSYPADRLEILVVDNAVHECVPGLDWPANVQLLQEPQPGSYAARNMALRHANGDVIAFTDSDCVPHKEWISCAVAHLKMGYDRVAGRVELSFQNSARSLVEAHQAVFAFDQARHAMAGTSVTANLVVWKHCFERVGVFNSLLMSGGDMEWGHRATACGMTIVYASGAVVVHPARCRLDQLLKKQKRVIGAVGALNQYQPERFWLLRAFVPPLKAAWRIVAARELSAREKIGVFCLSYLLKVTGAYYRAAIQLGVLDPPRS